MEVEAEVGTITLCLQQVANKQRGQNIDSYYGKNCADQVDWHF